MGAQERILGFNDQGEEKWHIGNTLPQGWHKQDPTIVAEPVQETHELTVDELPKGLPMGSQEQPETASATDEKSVEESTDPKTEAEKPAKKKPGPKPKAKKGD